MLLRIEDLDPGRSRPEFGARLKDDLAWLGIDWAGETVQSDRAALYQAQLDRLRGEGLAYPCFCTRADIAAAAAPHGPQAAYPGTCRDLPDDPARRAASPHSWRLNSERAIRRVGLPTWVDKGRMLTAARAEIDDIILARKDALSSYHLACVTDDWDTGVTLVVRGDDLRQSTPVQRVLQMLLGMPAPDYCHHPLVVGADGQRLAKRDQAPTLAALRESGVDGRALARSLRMDLLPSGFSFARA